MTIEPSLHGDIDTLFEMEPDARRAQALEGVLRRIVRRMCIAMSGLDEELDKALDPMAHAIRREADSPELESLLIPLSTAIAALDIKPVASRNSANASSARATVDLLPASARPASANPSTDLAALLACMIDELDTFPELQMRVAALKTPFNDPPSLDLVTERLREVADIVRELLTRLRRERGDAESMVQQFTEQLDAITEYLRGDASDHETAQDASRELKSRVLDEVSHIDSTVRQATDLGTLRTQVRERLDAIDSHVQEFRSREEARTQVWRERAECMNARVADLERQTHDLQRSLRKEQLLAITDSLTGIANRLGYEERIALDFLRWQRQGLPMTIGAWDIDDFKAVNDRYGHKAGDKILQIVAQHMTSHLRASDFVARYGGEEFITILDGATLPEAIAKANQLRESISLLGFHYRGTPIAITISCGLSRFKEGDTPESVFERADALLYEAKNGGRNRCVGR